MCTTFGTVSAFGGIKNKKIWQVENHASDGSIYKDENSHLDRYRRIHDLEWLFRLLPLRPVLNIKTGSHYVSLKKKRTQIELFGRKQNTND